MLQLWSGFVALRLHWMLSTTLMHVADGLCMIAGLKAELEPAVKLSTEQAAELTELKKAAVAMTESHDALVQELQSSSEQLDQTESQLSDLNGDHQSLQQQYDAQAGQCTDLESQLKQKSGAVLQLQERLQAETQASTAVQQELEGASVKTPICNLFASLMA